MPTPLPCPEGFSEACIFGNRTKKITWGGGATQGWGWGGWGRVLRLNYPISKFLNRFIRFVDIYNNIDSSCQNHYCFKDNNILLAKTNKLLLT